MFVFITLEQINLIKELCLVEIENCARKIAENQSAALNVVQLYHNRGECLIDFLEQLEHVRRI